MKKLKKSLNKKPVFVFIYGPIAVGKFTIAKELAKKTGFKNFHNHLIIDLCLGLFGKDDERRSIFRENIYFKMIETLIKLKVSVVITHAFASNFTFNTGMTDPEYVKKTQDIVIKNGGIFYGVQLVCDDKELLRRVKNESRKEFSKLKNVKIAKDLLDKYDHITPAPIKNNLVINNTNLTPKKVADIIIKNCNLK